MKRKLIEHFLSILFVGVAFVSLLLVIKERERAEEIAAAKQVQPYLNLRFIDFGNPLHAELFRETLDIFHSDLPAKNDSLLQAIQEYRLGRFTNRAYKTGGEGRGLTWAKASSLGMMYLQFLVVYVVVLLLSYYCAQSLAIYRFVKMKQNRSSYLAELVRHLARAGPDEKLPRGFSFYKKAAVFALKALIKGIVLLILFSPAYVIAYSIKTRVDTESYLFMFILGVVSNGLLVNYANKFYTFLMSESRKGYVETAIVKNLNTSYAWKKIGGIPYKAIFSLKKAFPAHVFHHIYINARYQYIPTMKEHASFLITGLIIIEMALNIQGHLCYELLQNILYKQYDVVIAILLGIFLVVKATEIAVDTWYRRESRHYENRL